jgi:hypothetical protein|tara:strand:- start:16316 stop:16519 length:204 start_codon:yes stop_codon:yes gene_type:complete
METIIMVISLVLNFALVFMLKRINTKHRELSLKHKVVQDYAERIAANFLEYKAKKKTRRRQQKPKND